MKLNFLMSMTKERVMTLTQSHLLMAKAKLKKNMANIFVQTLIFLFLCRLD